MDSRGVCLLWGLWGRRCSWALSVEGFVVNSRESMSGVEKCLEGSGLSAESLTAMYAYTKMSRTPT